eukprot:6065845-Ditylum_brightwellii.AAC.1
MPVSFQNKQHIPFFNAKGVESGGEHIDSDYELSDDNIGTDHSRTWHTQKEKNTTTLPSTMWNDPNCKSNTVEGMIWEKVQLYQTHQIKFNKDQQNYAKSM